jgi:hypothetical protein
MTRLREKELCRYVRHYHAKNGYAPDRGTLGCTPVELSELEARRLVEVYPLYEGGPRIKIVLTDKGLKLAS